MTQPLTDPQMKVLMLLANHPQGMWWEQLAAQFRDRSGKTIASLGNDLGVLVRGGAVQARGSMPQAELDAEYQEACQRLRQAQLSGGVFTWQTRQRFAYVCTKSGHDMVRLMVEHQREKHAKR